MKKTVSFITAFMLFIVVAVSLHFTTGDKLDTNNPEFGTWINTKKDLSYKAISQNLEEDTVVMMGSSEFHHGKKTPYHPTNIFRSIGMNVMCLGAAQNQTLSHVITLSAIAPKLENKKVVLLLSPSWFSKKGAEGSGFSARFSESEYEAMLKNENLSIETREAMADRATELLEVSPKTHANIQTTNKIFLSGDASLKDKIDLKINNWITREKEDINVGVLWKAAGGKKHHKYKANTNFNVPDWDALAEEADASIAGDMNEDFHVPNKMYKKKIKPMLDERKGADVNRTYGNSPEYDDLRLFLDVCKEENIEVLLVMQPVNGWWYDYTGFPKKNRETFVTEVQKVADEYGVETCNFFDQCYTPGFLEDIVHPAGKGWVRINEAAYEFFAKA